MNFSTVRFVFDEAEARRLLYEHFEVIEPMLGDAPVYIGSCRVCGRMVVTMPRGSAEVSAKPILEGLDHLRSHGPR